MVLFIAVPIAELYLIVQSAHAFGALETIVALIAISFAGAWLMKHQGFRTLAAVQDALGRGRIPTRELQDGALILLAGALLLTPGFLSDVVAILLLLPPTRALARTVLAWSLRGRIRVTATAGAPGAGRWGDVIDVDSDEDPPPSAGAIPLEP